MVLKSGYYLLYFICLYFCLVDCLPECFMDCDIALRVELQGHNLTADCRCWDACEPHHYTPEALKVINDYHTFEPKHWRKALYVRRDCAEAVMAAAEVEDVDYLLDELWAPTGKMYARAKESPSINSVSAPKDWVLIEANYHCPTTKQSPYIIRQLRFYRQKAIGGRALYFHRDCNRVRYAYGKESPEIARQTVIKSLTDSNHTVNEWFLYDWNAEGFCSPLTHRVRKELRDLSDSDQIMFFNAMNEAYRRGLYHMHSPYHAQQLMYSFAHGTPGFTKYHRLAILHIEEQLRGLYPKNRCITVPYWHWGRDVNIMKSTIFTPELLGSIENIYSQGDCGTSGDGCCVRDGKFAGWEDMYGRCLKRNFADFPPEKIGLPSTAVCVELITKYKNFGFEKYGVSIYTSGIVPNILDDCLVQCGDEADERGTCTPLCHGLISTKKIRGFTGDLELSHNRVHFSIGGHMFASNSPNDPLFLLNHGFVDKIYDRWQRCQGKTQPFYWVTNQEHLCDAFTVQGLYGLSDRVLGWTMTIGEIAFNRNIGYTSYEYAVDEWEKDNNLVGRCPSYEDINKYDEKLKLDRWKRANLIFQKNVSSLDDTPTVKTTGERFPGLLETHDQKAQSRKRFAFVRKF